jgi:hypothetical protein
MKTDKWTKHRFFLYFLDSFVESQYRAFILERAIIFTRMTWGLVIFLCILFSILDKQFFGESASTILVLRIGIILVAATAFLVSGTEKKSHLMDWNGFVFVISLGMFCIFLVFMDTTKEFSIYFTGLLLIFPGVFCTPGIGFRYSFFALILNMICFDILFGLIMNMPADLFLAYNVFLSSLVLIYVYLGFLVESIFRKNYVTSEKLKITLSEVHQLSGLLPICANCKKTRDDKGYWNQIESYFEKHSGAAFSHGMCPECSEEFYGKEEWFIKMKKKKQR